MSSPDHIERGSTIYWSYDRGTRRWTPCNFNPAEHLAAGNHVMETYVTHMYEPKEPPPRKVPKYKPVYKPRAIKRKAIMPIATIH